MRKRGENVLPELHFEDVEEKDVKLAEVSDEDEPESMDDPRVLRILGLTKADLK